MSRMTKQNLRNIKDRFERKTGAQLEPGHRQIAGRRLFLLAAAAAACAMIAAFTHPLFTPLDGDELTLGGTYLGDGIVSVRVENNSDKVLTFTDAKLFSWNDGEVAMIPGGKVALSGTKVEPHGEGLLTVDLSGAYDIAFLESTTPGKPKQSWYYLLLTNQSFLFGHDWMCSFHFVQEEAQTQIPQNTGTQTPVPQDTGPQTPVPEEIPEELRFYFERAYYDVLPAFNEQHFVYQQKVQEILMRTDGTLVRPVDPMLLVEPPEQGVIFDDTVAQEEQERLVSQHHSSLDGYRRMVGTSFSGVASDFSLQLFGSIPQKEGDTDGTLIPLIYLVVYETQAVTQEGAYTFLSGRILPFDKLEDSMVFEDEQYTVYDVTKLFYEDLDAYIDTFVSENPVCFDESVRLRLHRIYDYYHTGENLTFYYPMAQ